MQQSQGMQPLAQIRSEIHENVSALSRSVPLDRQIRHQIFTHRQRQWGIN